MLSRTKKYSVIKQTFSEPIIIHSVVCSDVMDAVGPLQEKMDEWRKATTALDKDHAKGDSTVFST